jgi:hypothetical protein
MSISQVEMANFFQDVRRFFRTLDEKEKDFLHDLEMAHFNFQSGGRVCDFGCGDGLSTLSLISVLEPSKAFGIDKSEQNIIQANLWGQALKKFLELSESNHVQENKLRIKAKHLLTSLHFIEFSVGDVVKGNEMPLNIDIAYCNLLLVNIYNNAYDNYLSGIVGVEAAIKNIVKSINTNGYFLAIEQYGHMGINFNHLFEKAGLKGDGIPFLRKPITTNGRGIAENYIRYVYRKCY